MIDHLLVFADEAAAQTDPVVGAYYVSQANPDPGRWREDTCIPGIQVYALAADGVTRVPYPGWFILISRPALDPTLQDMPGHACRLIADRMLAAAGKPYLIYTAPDLDPTALATTHVEPTFAGCRYALSPAPPKPKAKIRVSPAAS